MAAHASRVFAPTRRLEGKIALITGAARGIGESIARVFASHGAKVFVADISEDLGRSVSENLGPQNAFFIHCDVTKESHVENAVKAAVDRYGKLDIMVNNAGIADEPKPNITDVHISDFDRVLAVNLTGPFLGTKYAARAMIPANSGSIINLASVAGIVGGAVSHAYSSAKHGVVGLTRNTAAELGQYGIRVNCLSPYVVVTELTKDFYDMDRGVASGIYSNLKGMIIEPEDVANAAVFLASDESRFISGHNLAVDGGYSVINPAFGLFKRM